MAARMEMNNRGGTCDPHDFITIISFIIIHILSIARRHNEERSVALTNFEESLDKLIK